MRIIRVIWMRLRSVGLGRRVDRELRREMDTHLAELEREAIADGCAPEEARRRARREFGPIASLEEACRDTRRVSALLHLARDLRYAVRGLIRQPMLLLASSASMALGVGANLIVIGLAQAMLFAPPSARQPEDLVQIRTRAGPHVPYEAWRQLQQSAVLQDLAGYRLGTNVVWRTGNASGSLVPLSVTANFFDAVGPPVAMGRGFTAGEAAPDRDPRVVVVSHGFWQQALAGAGEIVGRSLVINGEPHTIIGVLPADARSWPGFGLSPDVYLPMTPSTDGGFDGVQLVGRLMPGQEAGAARPAVAAALARLGKAQGDENALALMVLAPIGGMAQSRDLPVLNAFAVVLMVVASLVLLIATANVAGLLLARGAARQHEMSLRAALGASRGRLLQQLLTEGAVLAVAGTAAGLMLTWAIAQWLSTVALPFPVPVRLRLAFDTTLWVSAAALVVVSTVLCALAPAWRGSRVSLQPGLLERERGAGRRWTFRRVLVSAQIACSLVLLATALVFARNLMEAQRLQPGFDLDRSLVAEVTFVEGQLGQGGQPAVQRFLDAFRAVPGVEAVSLADGVPLTVSSGTWNNTEIEMDGRSIRVEFARNRVGADYFKVMGIPLTQGRLFTDAEAGGAVLVNEEFVRRYVPEGSALGRMVRDRAWRDSVAHTIVGVVANSKYLTLGEAQAPAIYDAYRVTGRGDRVVNVMVRTAGPPAAMVDLIRRKGLEVDGTSAVTVQPLRNALAFAFLPSEIGATLLGALGITGTILAMLGVYGVVTFSVTSRTREVGIRLTLGATRAGIVGLIARDIGRLVGVGLFAGIGLALLLTAPLSVFLVDGLSPRDPAAWAMTIAVLTGVAAAAALGPVQRLVRMPAAVTLRRE